MATGSPPRTAGSRTAEPLARGPGWVSAGLGISALLATGWFGKASASATRPGPGRALLPSEHVSWPPRPRPPTFKHKEDCEKVVLKPEPRGRSSRAGISASGLGAPVA